MVDFFASDTAPQERIVRGRIELMNPCGVALHHYFYQLSSFFGEYYRLWLD
jgi:hypothetical protein